MVIVLKTKKGYLNFEKGIKIVNDVNNATSVDMSKLSETKKRIYEEKPMIGYITSEVIY